MVSCRTPEAELVCGLTGRSRGDPWDGVVGRLGPVHLAAPQECPRVAGGGPGAGAAVLSGAWAVLRVPHGPSETSNNGFRTSHIPSGVHCNMKMWNSLFKNY